MKTATAIVSAIAALTLFTGCTATSAAPPPAEGGAAVVPQECLDALDDAEHLDTLMGTAIDSAGRAMEAAAIWDDAAIDEETAAIEELTPEVHATRASFEANAATCRGES